MMEEGEEFVERGIFSGEGVRPHRSYGEKEGSLPVSSELLNMLLHVRPERWWEGGGRNFFGGWSLSEEDVRGSLAVSSELLNMLLHVKPGRWLRGDVFSAEGVRSGRFSGDVCT